MDKDKKREKIVAFFKKHPRQYFGAFKIDGILRFDKGGNNGHKSWNTHKILEDLVVDGFLEQKKGKGFKLKGT